jgi:hypothetical protein
MSDGLELQRAAGVVLDGTLRPHEPAVAPVRQIELALERIGFVGNRGPVGIEWERLSQQFDSFPTERPGVGVVHKRELSIHPITAD